MSSGAVTATALWNGETPDITNFRIAIHRAGALVLDAAVSSSECLQGQLETCLWPGNAYPVALRDLEGDGEPETIVNAFTRGAHCCFVALVYRWNGDAYVQAERNFGDPGFRLVDLDHDGKTEFRTADKRFAFLYGSYADSIFPIQVMRFTAGAFRDVTRAFPALVRGDARRLGREYRRRARHPSRGGVRPALAAYAADLYRAGRGRIAARTLQSALRQGLLRKHQEFDIGPYGAQYVRDLKRRLKRWGYRP